MTSNGISEKRIDTEENISKVDDEIFKKLI
jgi:hypothetical protein